MPAAFLARQMAWREALDEAPDATAVERLDAEVAGHEGQALDELRVALDERGDVQAAAALVRSLMFDARFRDDVRRRLEALDA